MFQYIVKNKDTLEFKLYASWSKSRGLREIRLNSNCLSIHYARLLPVIFIIMICAVI